MIKYTNYVAFDGRIFDNINDCLKYENENVKKIITDYNNLHKVCSDECTLFHNFGCEDTNIDILPINNVTERTIVYDIFITHNEYDREGLRQLNETLDNVLEDKDDFLLIFRGIDDTNHFYNCKSLKTFIIELSALNEVLKLKF